MVRSKGDGCHGDTEARSFRKWLFQGLSKKRERKKRLSHSWQIQPSAISVSPCLRGNSAGGFLSSHPGPILSGTLSDRGRRLRLDEDLVDHLVGDHPLGLTFEVEDQAVPEGRLCHGLDLFEGNVVLALEES